MIKNILSKTFRILPSSLKKIYFWGILQKWKLEGRPVPPPHLLKQKVVSEYQKKFNSKILVETGTFMGEMVEAQRKRFKKIYTIELDKKLWENAANKFKKYPEIEIIRGDSGKVLKKIVPKLNERSVFWLDSHYSGGLTAKGDKETPIIEELKTILSSKINHIILIDDARCFNGKNDYPTIKKLKEFILKKRPHSKIEIKEDIIRIVN